MDRPCSIRRRRRVRTRPPKPIRKKKPAPGRHGPGTWWSHDDPVTLMSYVTNAFMEIFGYSRTRAHQLMMEVPHHGPVRGMDRRVANRPRSTCTSYRHATFSPRWNGWIRDAHPSHRERRAHVPGHPAHLRGPAPGPCPSCLPPTIQRSATGSCPEPTRTTSWSRSGAAWERPSWNTSLLPGRGSSPGIWPRFRANATEPGR